MNVPAMIEGTLKPDGTLELDQKPNLPPGRVQVIVQPLAASLTGATRGLADVIDEIRQTQFARGFTGRSPEELAAEEQDRRGEQDDYDQRMQALWSQTRSGPPGKP